jgi:hypothetical protein
MEENALATKAMLEQILKRLDDQIVVSDQRYEAQAAFNTQVSQDLQSVRKQLDLTQVDVDEARKASSSAVPPAASQATETRVLGMQTSLRPGTARLANDGPPLIPESPAVQLVPQPPPLHLTGARRNVEPHHNMHQDNQEVGGFVKPPKHDFPRFEGTLPNLWIDRCLSYFGLYRVPIQNWVTTASLYMDGHAALWLQAFRQAHPQITWEQFRQSV